MEVDSVLSSMDATLQQSRQLDLLFENMLLERRMGSLSTELHTLGEGHGEGEGEGESQSHRQVVQAVVGDREPGLSEADWTGTIILLPTPPSHNPRYVQYT